MGNQRATQIAVKLVKKINNETPSISTVRLVHPVSHSVRISPLQAANKHTNTPTDQGPSEELKVIFHSINLLSKYPSGHTCRQTAKSVTWK